MNERAPVSGEDVVHLNREESFFSVCDNLRKHLEILEEAFQEYPVVTFPNGETRTPESKAEEAVGKIQRYKDAIDGLLEQNAEAGDSNERVVEEALRLSKEGIEHLEGFLSIQADLATLAKDKGNKGAEELADVLDTVAHTLLAPAREVAEATKSE